MPSVRIAVRKSFSSWRHSKVQSRANAIIRSAIDRRDHKRLAGPNKMQPPVPRTGLTAQFAQTFICIQEFLRGGIMSDPLVQPVAEPAPGLSQLQRVSNVFTAPSKTFDDIKRGNKSWWMPFIIFTLVGYVLFAAIVTKIGMQQVVDNQIHLNPKQEEKLAQAPPEQREMSAKISLYITEGIFLANPLLLLAILALGSLGLWGTINFAFGGKATYGSIFTVWMYAGLPGILKVLLGVIVIFAGTAPESFNIKNYARTNLGAFLNPLETNAALYSLASAIDITTIWTLVLLGIGTATVAGVKRTSGYIAVFGWWAVFALIGVGIAAVTG
jgi:hypothetical protein